MGRSTTSARGRAPRARRLIAAPVVALVAFGALAAVAAPAFAATAIGNVGLCVGVPAPGGCDAGGGGTTQAAPNATVTLGLTFTATSGLAAGKVVGIDSQPTFPNSMAFSSADADYSVTNVTKTETCALDADITQYNPNIVFVPMPAGCVADSGDQIVVTLNNAVMPGSTGPLALTVSTQTDDSTVPTNAIDLVGPPSPPTSPHASGGDHSITVSWSVPDSNGGSALTGYDVYCAIGTPSTSGTPSATTDAATTSTTVAATGHQRHTCVVTAENAAGASDASDEVSAAPTSVPNAPTGVYTLDYNHQIVVRWTRPTVRGGTPITHYRVYCSATDFATVDPSDLCATTGGTAREATLTNLTNLDPYSIIVVAQNSVGVSKPSAGVVGTPSRAPSVVRAVQATPVTGGIVLSWKPPKSDFGSPVQAYFALCATNPDLTDAAIASTDGSTTQAELDGLTSGTLYYCVVNALNGAGQVSRDSVQATATPL